MDIRLNHTAVRLAHRETISVVDGKGAVQAGDPENVAASDTSTAGADTTTNTDNSTEA